MNLDFPRERMKPCKQNPPFSAIDHRSGSSHHFRLALLLVLCFASAPLLAQKSSLSEPPQAVATVQGTTFSLSNRTISATWRISAGGFKIVSIKNRFTGKMITHADNAFALTINDGNVIKSSEMVVRGGPTLETLHADPNRSRLSERSNGKKISLQLQDKEGRLSVIWSGFLRDGSNYIRQEVEFQAKDHDLAVTSIRLIDIVWPGARIIGTVKGSPVVAGDFFMGFEHPLSESKVSDDRVLCKLSRELPLKAGQSVTYSSVIGVMEPGQMRRGFLQYVERERAHPYRTFLHYNSWYDLGYFSKFDEAGALGVIETFGRELTEKRGVQLDSFLFDDGWDDPSTLWKFHSGFPNGFTPLKEAAAKFKANPGVWLSPWGGYGKPKQERLKFGKEAGFETNAGGFALSGPKYFARFREVTLEFIRNYGINQFKIDGTGNADSAYRGSAFDSDFDAAISLIREWRSVKPDIYVNLTTGTYPSPFWLQTADSIWRGGDDHSFTGVGSDRQKWITYRDADTFDNVVQAGPLFPLNSLMLHGLIYAQHARKLDVDPKGDFADEVHSYFGTGTQLQEMYITPTLLSKDNWDTLAEAAKWSRKNSDVLVDSHWVGGDPAMLEVYGWASWSPKKGILVLRNPSDKTQDFTLDLRHAFELPSSGATSYVAHSPWQKDLDLPSIAIRADVPHQFHLKPFEVLTLELVPKTK
jgi:hypothetical protein